MSDYFNIDIKIVQIIIVGVLIKVLFRLRKYFNGPAYKVEPEDMSFKTVIVTGANTGIGFETAKDLLNNGATVIFACRSEERAKKAISSLTDVDHKNRAHFMKLDLCLFSSIKTFCNNVRRIYESIDIIVNNAGLLEDNFYKTKDGIEACLQANHIGHMVLTYLLLDLVNKEDGRIINVSSMGHKQANYNLEEIKRMQGDLEFKGSEFRTHVGSMQNYANTKLANIWFTKHLAQVLEKEFAGDNIKTASLHPGVVNTEFSRFMSDWSFFKRNLVNLIYPIIWFVLKTPKMGAATTLHLCYDDIKNIENGEYYKDCGRTPLLNEVAKSEECIKEFMKFSWMLVDRSGEEINLKVPKIGRELIM